MKLAQETIEHSKDCRDFESLNELVSLLRQSMKIWSWGARGWTNYQNRILAFRVSGHHFSGNVAIMVNGSDLFDIHYCNSRGRLIDSMQDVFIGDLIDTIDRRVERIPEYAQ